MCVPVYPCTCDYKTSPLLLSSQLPERFGPNISARIHSNGAGRPEDPRKDNGHRRNALHLQRSPLQVGAASDRVLSNYTLMQQLPWQRQRAAAVDTVRCLDVANDTIAQTHRIPQILARISLHHCLSRVQTHATGLACFLSV